MRGKRHLRNKDTRHGKKHSLLASVPWPCMDDDDDDDGDGDGDDDHENDPDRDDHSHRIHVCMPFIW